MRAVGYARVSTLEQKQKGASLPHQKRRIRAYAESRDWRLTRVYEEARSGRGFSTRPVFEQMLDAVLSNGIGVVVVTKLDRLGRNMREIVNTFYRLSQKGAHVVVVDVGLDTTTPAGRLVLHVLAGLAEYEAEQIKERTMIGRMAKKAKGGYTGGKPPFGKRVVAGELVKDEKEQEALQLIRTLHRRGKSLRSIAKALTDAGHKPRGKKVRDGERRIYGEWTPETIRKIVNRAI